MKNALGKLEIPMPAAMPCKTHQKKTRGKLAAVLGNTRPNMLVLSELCLLNLCYVVAQ